MGMRDGRLTAVPHEPVDGYDGGVVGAALGRARVENGVESRCVVVRHCGLLLSDWSMRRRVAGMSVPRARAFYRLHPASSGIQFDTGEAPMNLRFTV